MEILEEMLINNSEHTPKEVVFSTGALYKKLHSRNRCDIYHTININQEFNNYSNIYNLDIDEILLNLVEWSKFYNKRK